MKKVQIFTLCGYFNYGNRLQLFSLAKVVSEMGFQVTVYWPNRLISIIKELIKYYTPIRLLFKKEGKIRRFTMQNIPKATSRQNAEYSIVGSDQVWNLELFQDLPYLLDVPNESTKISYAASLGLETLTSEQKNLFKESLKKYTSISVREKSAIQLLQPLTSHPIKVVLDPTLLLGVEEYGQLEKRPKQLSADEKYVLCYILGNREYQSKIEQFAKKEGYRIITFSDQRDSNFGVEEFLYLIHNAELVCTDSFHACVFSFIFERPFIVFRRTGKETNMYSRIRDFVSLFHLEQHEYNGGKITKDSLAKDYAESKQILEDEKEKSLAFLRTALGVKK